MAIAFIISPLISPIVYYIPSWFYMSDTYGFFYSIDIYSLFLSLLFISAVALPITYLNLLFFGVPTYYILQKLNGLSLFRLVMIGIFFGIIEFITLVWIGSDYAKETFYSPQIFYFILLGIVLGGTVSLLFGIILGLRFRKINILK